jgi:hypothetical protein
MNTFISSVITGLEQERDAAADAAANLEFRVGRAEDFGASPMSPQEACLAGVRWANVVVLLLGGRYGERQESGLSATHEEFREAIKEGIPVIAFVQEGIARQPAQDQFVEEVREWQGGVLTGDFIDPPTLGLAVTQYLHRFALDAAASPADESDMLERADSLLPRDAWGFAGMGGSAIVSTVFGPRRHVLRPSVLEAMELSDEIRNAALVGPHAILDPSEGVSRTLRGATLALQQPSAGIQVDETGAIIIHMAAVDRADRAALPAIIEEDVRERLARALRLTSVICDRIDPTRALTHALPSVSLVHAAGYGWRTREEQLRNPNSMTMSTGVADPLSVKLAPPMRSRASLLHEASELALDFMVLLRRAFR